MREHAPVTVSPEEQAVQRAYMEKVRDLPHRPASYHVVTYGCQMNAHDSEKLSGMLAEMGMKEAPSREEADLVLFNTCCVRDNAERRALGNVTWLKELKKEKPQLIIGVCGCMIQQPRHRRRRFCVSTSSLTWPLAPPTFTACPSSFMKSWSRHGRWWKWTRRRTSSRRDCR